MANNHSLDAGTQGQADTKAAITGARVTYAYYDEVGVYETPEHRSQAEAVLQVRTR